MLLVVTLLISQVIRLTTTLSAESLKDINREAMVDFIVILLIPNPSIVHILMVYLLLLALLIDMRGVML